MMTTSYGRRLRLACAAVGQASNFVRRRVATYCEFQLIRHEVGDLQLRGACQQVTVVGPQATDISRCARLVHLPWRDLADL